MASYSRVMEVGSEASDTTASISDRAIASTESRTTVALRRLIVASFFAILALKVATIVCY